MPNVASSNIEIDEWLFDGSLCTDYYYVAVPDKWSGHRRNIVAVDDVYIACNMGVRDTAHTMHHSMFLLHNSDIL